MYKTFSLAKHLANSLCHFSLLGIRYLKLFPSHISRAELHLHFRWGIGEGVAAELEAVYSWPEPVLCFSSVSVVSLLLHKQAPCPRRSLLGCILTFRCRIKEQINLGGIHVTGWKDWDCMYVTRARADFWFPSLCAPQLPPNFRLVWTEVCASLSFPPHRTAWLLCTPSAPGTGLWVHENTLAGKTTLEKRFILSLPKQDTQTYSFLLEMQAWLFMITIILLHFVNYFNSNSWCLVFLLLLWRCTPILLPGHFPLISQLISAIGFIRCHREFGIFSHQNFAAVNVVL